MDNHAKRIHRYHRFNTPGHAHFLTFSCFQNQPLLEIEATKKYLAESIIESVKTHNFELWAYVFMPEHVHILIYPDVENYSISDILRSIKQSSSRKIINYLKAHNIETLKQLETGLKSPKYRFWHDGGGYDRNCRTVEEITNSIQYIHENPVRSGLVDRAEDWYWSSAKDWNEDGGAPLLIKREILAEMVATKGSGYYL